MLNEYRWTDERVEQLKADWASGWTASQIAVRLGGVTKNAVLGKVDRLGLDSRRNTSALKATKPRKPRRERQVRRPWLISRPIETPSCLPEFIGVGFFETTETTCMYPEGHGREMLFCGQPRQDGSSYCAGHHRICWVKPTKEPKRYVWREVA